ncbi:MAG: hypothetical protein Kow00108_10400 [Calditrichia bacterium]
MKRLQIKILIFLLTVVGLAQIPVQPKISAEKVRQSIEEFTGNNVPVEWKTVNLPDKSDFKKKFKIYTSDFPKVLHYGVFHYQNEEVYVIPAQVKGKTLPFSFLLYLSKKDLTILYVDVVEYRESHGDEIDMTVFKKQFQGKKNSKDIRYRRTIKSITGATISSRAITLAIGDLMLVVEKLRSSHLL